MKSSNVAQQQSGLIVRLAIYLQREKVFSSRKTIDFLSCVILALVKLYQKCYNGLTSISPFAGQPTGLALALSFPAANTPLRKGVTP